MADESPSPAVGDLVRTPRGEGRVVAVDAGWLTVEVDLCGFTDTVAVKT